MNSEQKTIRAIGIRGTHPGCGKDTVASMVKAKLSLMGKEANIVKYATPLRQVLEILTGVSVVESETIAGKNRFLPKFNMTVGQLLQHLGTEVIRNNTHPDVWVDALFAKRHREELLIVSDVRFVNEQSAVQQRDGVVILVSSNRCFNEAQMAGRSTIHASERNLDGINADYEIRNDGSFDDLMKAVDSLVEKLFPNR